MVRYTRRGHSRSIGDLPILVLHGWGAHIEAIEPILAGLADVAEVIALDMPGFGASKPPSRTWDADDYSQFVQAFLDEQGITRCHVVGHSFGGRVAICLAAEQPDRVGRLLLCDAAGLRPRRGVRYRVRVGVAKFGRLLGRFGSKGRALQERLRRRVASSDYLQASEAMRGTFRAIIDQDLAGRLPRISAPTVLVWGDQDDDTPLSVAKRMEQLIPDVGLIIFRGAGHYSYADEPGRFRQVARTFLIEQPRLAAEHQARKG